LTEIYNFATQYTQLEKKRIMQTTKGVTTQRNYWILFLLVFSLAGFIAVAYATVWGAALSDDSYFYISPARSLLSGQGFNLTAK